MPNNLIIKESEKTPAELQQDINRLEQLYTTYNIASAQGADQAAYSASRIAKRYHQLYQKTQLNEDLFLNAQWLVNAYNQGSGYACYTLANAIRYQETDRNKRYQIGALEEIDISSDDNGYKQLINEALDKGFGPAYNDLRQALRHSDDPESALRIEIIKKRGGLVDKETEYKFLFVAAADHNLEAAQIVCQKYFHRDGTHSEKLVSEMKENGIDIAPFIKKCIEIGKNSKKYAQNVKPVIKQHFQEAYTDVTNDKTPLDFHSIKMRLIN